MPAKEQILVCTEDNHSKFWMYTEANGVYTARWGRLGTKGGQPKTYSYSEIVSKVYEKQRKGYKQITRDVYEQKTVEAAIVGTQNKCHTMRWLEQKKDASAFGSLRFADGVIYAPVDERRLQEPDCEPALMVVLETRKEYLELLFTPDGSYLLGSTGSRSQGLSMRQPVTKGHALYELVAKVEESLGRGLA
jgi:predicted DNA-binding WGR domain protein